MKGGRFASHALPCLFPEACPEKAGPPLPGDGESDYNLDYLLALSLQQENSFGQRSVAELQRELWKNICPPQAGPADHCGKAKNSRDPSQDLLVAANNLNRPKSTLVFLVAYPGIAGRGRGYRKKPKDPALLLSCSGLGFFPWFTEEQHKLLLGGSSSLAEE